MNMGEYICCLDQPLPLREALSIRREATRAVRAITNGEPHRRLLRTRTFEIERVMRFSRISVCDTGRGIHPSVVISLGEPFLAKRSDEGGTGVGLSIVGTIAERHGGRLLFRSNGEYRTIAELRSPATQSRSLQSRSTQSRPARTRIPQ